MVAAATGGLLTAVADDVSGVLVDGHDPRRWAKVLGELLDASDRLARLGEGGLRHAQGFGWAVTAARMLDVYSAALAPPERSVTMLR